MDSAWSPIARSYDPLKAGSIDGTDVKPHDHGIVRAMEATYKTNKYVMTDPRLTIFVARLSPATTEDTIKEFFSDYGDIKSCHLVRDVVTGFSKRYAFIEFYEMKDALAASAANQLAIDDCKIFVDFEQERVLPGWIPRRQGGGFGGKKESGQLRFGGLDRPFRKPIVLGSKTGPGDSRSSEPGAAFPNRNNQFLRRREGHYPSSDYRVRDHDKKDEFLRRKRLSYERTRERSRADYRNEIPERPYSRPRDSSSDRWRQYEDRERFERHGKEHRSHRSQRQRYSAIHSKMAETSPFQ